MEPRGKLDTQGGGHGRILQCQIAYPGISKPLTFKEGKAYEDLVKTPLASCIPKFYGIINDNIVIDDLTAGFDSPCVADLKIGTRHYDLQATQKKIDELTQKQIGSTTDSHGVRLISAKMRKAKAVTKHWEKDKGLKFSYEELKQVVNEFIPPELRQEFKLKMIRIYGKLAEMLLEYPGFRMYASSVLAVYDGDHLEKGIRVAIIDFAHTYVNVAEEGGNVNDHGLDDGVLKGVGAIIELLE